MKAALYEDFRDKFEVEVPLTSTADVAKLRQDLGVPDYVDVEDYVMRRLVVTTWAARNVDSIRGQAPNDLRKKLPEKPIDVAFFGGTAFRLVCRSSNRPGPFFRNINDLDIVTTGQRGLELVALLSALRDVFGTEYFHFLTATDRLFNNAMRPKRFRVHAINRFYDGLPVAGEMDIFCDRIAMCHTIDVREEIRSSPQNSYTIGLEKLLLTKLQFIKKIPKDAIDPSNEFRIMQHFDDKNVLVGLQDKDVIDVMSAFYDYNVGEELGQIRIGKLRELLERDADMCRTVCLNVQSILKNTSRLNFPAKHVSIIQGKIETLMKELPESKQGLLGRFRKQWWETVEE